MVGFGFWFTSSFALGVLRGRWDGGVVVPGGRERGRGEGVRSGDAGGLGTMRSKIG